jgi:hypothetical protein
LGGLKEELGSEKKWGKKLGGSEKKLGRSGKKLGGPH